jgi:hypothetical protein
MSASPRSERIMRFREMTRSANNRHWAAPPHLITSSARASTDGGTVRPSIFGVFRLIASSNFSACTTGTARPETLRSKSGYLGRSRPSQPECRYVGRWFARRTQSARPPHHQAHLEILSAACSPPALGHDIVSAQTVVQEGPVDVRCGCGSFASILIGRADAALPSKATKRPAGPLCADCVAKVVLHW